MAKQNVGIRQMANNILDEGNMSYLILSIISIFMSFFMCFFFQYIIKNEDKSKWTKCILPKTTELKIWFCIFVCMLVVGMNFVELMYNTSLIQNISISVSLSILGVSAYTDFKEHIISNKLILFGIVAWIIFTIIQLLIDFQNNYVSVLKNMAFALAVFVIGLLLVIVTKGSLGMGDVKLLCIMNLLLYPFGFVMSLLVSLLVSFIYCVVVLISRKKTRKDIIPFAPSLLVGFYLTAILFGC